MNAYVIVQSNIPIPDLGDIEIIEPIDNELLIQHKMAKLRNRMLYQANLLKQWHQQDCVLTEQQSRTLLCIQPMMAAYFTQHSLYRINEKVASMEQLGKELHKYAESIIEAIDSAEDTVIVDNSIIPWINTKFMRANG